MISRRVIAAVAFLAVHSLGCSVFGSGPSNQEVVAAIRKSPPAPPTIGPTYVAEVKSVEVAERGRYNAGGKYWPVRVRVKGGVKVKVTNIVQFGLRGNPEKQPPKAVDFVEEGYFTKDDFGNWQVSYNYDPNGPKWRLSAATSASRP